MQGPYRGLPTLKPL